MATSAWGWWDPWYLHIVISLHHGRRMIALTINAVCDQKSQKKVVDRHISWYIILCTACLNMAMLFFIVQHTLLLHIRVGSATAIVVQIVVQMQIRICERIKYQVVYFEGRTTLIGYVFRRFFFFVGFNKAQSYEYCEVFCKDYFSTQDLAITFFS